MIFVQLWGDVRASAVWWIMYGQLLGDVRAPASCYAVPGHVFALCNILLVVLYYLCINRQYVIRFTWRCKQNVYPCVCPFLYYSYRTLMYKTTSVYLWRLINWWTYVSAESRHKSHRMQVDVWINRSEDALLLTKPNCKSGGRLRR